eukprot:2306972-Prymnesium_polylepis.3
MKNMKKPVRGVVEEQVNGEQCGATFWRIAKAKAAAEAWGRVAHFDGEHAHVQQDEGEMRQRCHRTVIDPAKEDITRMCVRLKKFKNWASRFLWPPLLTAAAAGSAS